MCLLYRVLSSSIAEHCVYSDHEAESSLSSPIMLVPDARMLIGVYRGPTFSIGFSLGIVTSKVISYCLLLGGSLRPPEGMVVLRDATAASEDISPLDRDAPATNLAPLESGLA